MIQAIRRFWWETVPEAIWWVRERIYGAWLWMRGRKRRPAPTPGQIDQERETSVSLGLMAQAASAGANMTSEQQIFLSQSEHGMRERLGVLLSIPHRSLAQEREKRAIEGWLSPAPVLEATPQTIRGFGAFATTASPLMAIGGIRLWMILAAGWALTGGWALIQMGLKERIEDQRDEARRVAAENHEAAERWEERAEHYRQGLVDAADIARAAADQLAVERAAVARREARERRRNREIANVLTGAAEPPAWRLRDDEPAAESGSATPDP